MEKSVLDVGENCLERSNPRIIEIDNRMFVVTLKKYSKFNVTILYYRIGNRSSFYFLRSYSRERIILRIDEEYGSHISRVLLEQSNVKRQRLLDINRRLVIF